MGTICATSGNVVVTTVGFGALIGFGVIVTAIVGVVVLFAVVAVAAVSVAGTVVPIVYVAVIGRPCSVLAFLFLVWGTVVVLVLLFRVSLSVVAVLVVGVLVGLVPGALVGLVLGVPVVL